MLSGDCEQYPPLFRKREPESDESAMALEELQNEIEPVYIQLNDQGRDGSNIRKEPSMNGAVVGGVNGRRRYFISSSSKMMVSDIGSRSIFRMMRLRDG